MFIYVLLIGNNNKQIINASDKCFYIDQSNSTSYNSWHRSMCDGFSPVTEVGGVARPPMTAARGSLSNLAAALSAESTCSIVIVRGEPAVTKYFPGDGRAGYLPQPFFHRRLSLSYARSMDNFYVHCAAQWTRDISGPPLRCLPARW